MNVLSWTIILFLLLEGLNISILYFFPQTQKGNGMGAFKAYQEAQKHMYFKDLVSYLVNWVAGTKLIFWMLLVVILLEGSDTLKLYAIYALILSIGSFYWRLYPLIKKMDEKDQISPKGYSKTLGMMIACFILVFLGAVGVYWVL